jgi:hypothetical protein
MCILSVADKTKQTYINMFQHLVQSCPQSEVNIDISVLHLDFEIAVDVAVLSIWPNVLIKACQFHLGQAWYRKIQNLGLSGEYKQKESTWYILAIPEYVYSIKLVIKLWTVLKCSISKQMNVRLTHKLEVCLC